MQKQLQILGMISVGSDPQMLADTILQERRAMQPLVKELGIKLQ
jgi:hypothetical protein